MRATGPIVRHLDAVLLADRFLETGTLPPEADMSKPWPVESGRGGLAQVLPSGPGYAEGTAEAVMIALMYGALWLSLFAYAQFFASEVPPAERGHALGLLLFAFGVFTLWIFVASFRTNAVVVTALVFLAATLFVLGAGKYAANVDLIRVGGWLGFIAGAEAAYLSCAELCQIAYKREVLPIWSLAR